MGIYKKLLVVQSELKAPKSQYNNYGNFKYRNCEDILESLKPILAKINMTIIISDEIVNIADRFYVKATAKLIDIESGEHVEVSAFAREEENKKGMDGSQVTGASSSYARKYALNGLFAIDDTKDADTLNQQDQQPKQQPQKYKPLSKKKQAEINEAIKEYSRAAKKPVSDISNELKAIVKKELRVINENESALVLSYLRGKINKEIEGVS